MPASSPGVPFCSRRGPVPVEHTVQGTHSRRADPPLPTRGPTRGETGQGCRRRQTPLCNSGVHAERCSPGMSDWFDSLNFKSFNTPPSSCLTWKTCNKFHVINFSFGSYRGVPLFLRKHQFTPSMERLLTTYVLNHHPLESSPRHPHVLARPSLHPRGARGLGGGESRPKRREHQRSKNAKSNWAVHRVPNPFSFLRVPFPHFQVSRHLH